MSKKIKVIAFIVLLWIPIFVQLTGFENLLVKDFTHELATLKKNTIAGRISGDFNHNFGLRDFLVKTKSQFCISVLKESPFPHSVVVGKNGWYFLGNSYENVLNKSTGLEHFTNDELCTFVEVFRERLDWLKKHKIDYYFAVAPNKHSVYPEYLPFNLKQRKTKLDQLVETLDTALNFKVINIRDRLISLKDTTELYFLTNSHWNRLGAYYAYCHIMESINEQYPQIKVEDANNYQLLRRWTKREDISMAMQIDIDEYHVAFKPKMKPKSVEIKSSNNHSEFNVTNHPLFERRFLKEGLPYKILVFRDSFFGSMGPFFNENIGECVYIWQKDFIKEIVLKEKPDIVIHEVCERFLD
ncbi:MAG: hypothetical protein JW717_07525 [Marinilabiliaceae bacterium]|nr:hypothetical protein [Marinilabiliaceae bacterium]